MDNTVIKDCSAEPELDRKLPEGGHVSCSSAVSLREIAHSTMSGCRETGCAQVFITLQVVEALGCICHPGRKVFQQRVTSFQRQYGLDKISPSRSCIVECSGGNLCCCGWVPSESKEIIHPGDVESSVRDRMTISNIFETLSNRARSKEHQHIRFTLGSDSA